MTLWVIRRGQQGEWEDIDREYKPGYFVYSRPVRWLFDRCPREYFGDWLSRPHTTIYPVQERDAEQRVRELIRKPLT